ncbi:MAG: hypothetical protein QOC70_1025 [Verrucomicrobiota bacterium]|jgi:hypothetical protein
MPIPLTTAGRIACEELGQLNTLVLGVNGDNADHNKRVKERYGGGEEVNVEYTAYLQQSLGEWGVCRVVDIYQWYNRQVLRVAVQHAPEVLDGFRDAVRLDGRDVSALVTGINPVNVIIEKVLFRDNVVRGHLHKVLGIWEESEMSLLVEARNCFDHALGNDSEGRVAKALASKPSPWKLPLAVNAGRVVVTAETALSAIAIGLAQISIMDQQFGNKYSLPRTAVEPKKVSRLY